MSLSNFFYLMFACNSSSNNKYTYSDIFLTTSSYPVIALPCKCNISSLKSCMRFVRLALCIVIVIDQSKFNKAMIKSIVEWNEELDPPFNVVKSVISGYLCGNDIYQSKSKSSESQSQTEERVEPIEEKPDQTIHQTKVASQQAVQKDALLKQAVADVPKTLQMLSSSKCPKNFMRGYLSVIAANLEKVKKWIDLSHIGKSWKLINIELLEYYVQTFNIQFEDGNREEKLEQNGQGLRISEQQLNGKMQYLLNKKQYHLVLNLIKITGQQKVHINNLLSKMATNKEASRAADYIKALKLNPDDYPLIGERLYKNTARHFLSKNGWEYAEEIFEEHHEGLACIIEDLVFKEKYQEAYSIWYRHPNARKCILKEQALQYFAKVQKQSLKVNILENHLHDDVFGPSNHKYLSFQQFALKETDIIWIDQDTHQEIITEMINDIQNSKYIGVDTESIVGQTKFDKKDGKIDEAALVQIATSQKVYLLDGFRSKIKDIKHCLLKYLKNYQHQYVIGHSLDNDLDSLLKSVGCKEKEIKQLQVERVVDVWKLFKAINPDKKFSSLAFICENIFGKQLCKKYTLTNWQRRPLRKSQIHYAALDAFIVIKIYEKFVEEYGEQMVQYYLSTQHFDQATDHQ